MIRTKTFFEHYGKVVIWGAGSAFTKYYKRDVPIDYIVDSNPNVWGTKKCGIEVKSPNEVLKEDVDTTAVLICSQFEEEIYKSARRLGISCDIYSTSMLYPNPFVENDYYSLPEFIEDMPFINKYSVEKNVQILIALMKAHNIKKIVASPGGTNFCFLSSVQNDPFFEIYSSSDERSAAYIACGLSAESGEPVAINCTGATASRNYMPGMTEAYYRKLPILAITCSQYLGRIGQNCPQVTDRVTLPTDVAKLSVQLPMVQNLQDKWSCEVHVNRALLELKRGGGGPVHINLMTSFSTDCSIKALPSVKVIRRICLGDSFPELHQGRIGIFVGAHKRWTTELISAVEKFCELYDAVVICDQTSNYRGKYHVLAPLLLTQEVGRERDICFDLLIHIGDISGAYMSIRAKQIWRVNPDGEVRDTFARLKYVFEMQETEFFDRYAENREKIKFPKDGEAQALKWRKAYHRMYSKIPELPFSNMWVAQKTAPMIPNDSVIYFGILNSLRSWNFFELPQDSVGYANTGGFGIEGGMSSLFGASLANPNKLCFGIFGDLGFFSDMNVIGNRHMGRNLRIMLVNNGAGAEFYSKYSQCIQVFGDSVGKYCAADGHFGAKSDYLVKDFAENLGIRYICAKDKKEYMEKVKIFVDPKIGDCSILFEVFTDCEQEMITREILQTLVKN